MCRRWRARTRVLALLMGPLATLVFPGCDFGRVTQGRVVSYDKENKVITVVAERWDARAKSATYVLPAAHVKLPLDPNEMGLVPRSGRLLSVDSRRHELTYFDPTSASIKTISWQPITEQTGVFSDDAMLARANVPSVNPTAGSVTLYSPEERKLLEIAISSEQLGLPLETWRAGDTVRYYYKDPQQALRLMNVSRTDISKGH